MLQRTLRLLRRGCFESLQGEEAGSDADEVAVPRLGQSWQVPQW